MVIYLEGESASGEVVGELGQKDRRFSPDLVVVPMGSTVSFPNFDPIFHDVFSLSKAKSFDLGNYAQGHTRAVTFSNPGIVFVNCHLHANMAAVIVVTPNRWSTKADASGHFTIPQVPPGQVYDRGLAQDCRILPKDDTGKRKRPPPRGVRHSPG